MRNTTLTPRRCLSGLALWAAIGSCAVNPVTGKKELSFVSESQEIEMGRTYSAQIAVEMGTYPDTALRTYVANIGREMALASELMWARIPRVTKMYPPGRAKAFTCGSSTTW